MRAKGSKSSVYLSLTARILVNAEALNMAESVGNVTRHRKAPVVVSTKNGYSVFYVTAVSGEAIAHHYQRHLADIAVSMNLPVTSMDKMGYFLKYADNDVIKKYYDEIRDDPVIKEVIELTTRRGEEAKKALELKKMCDVERKLVEASVVADVGGFLYTNALVKRTSRIRFGYMLPALDAIERGAATSHPQIHTRYSPEVVEREQALYYVESGSSLYTFSAVLAVSDIAELEYCEEPGPILSQEKPKRIEAALKALLALVDGLAFGAKRSRYLPQWEVRSLLVGVSKGPIEFVVSPATRQQYVEYTIRRAEVVKNLTGTDIKLFLYDSENLPLVKEMREKVSIHGSHTEALKEAIEEIMKKT